MHYSDYEEHEEEELTVDEVLALAAAAETSSEKAPVGPVHVTQLASKDCLVCGRAYRYSHNARRHELNTHGYDRYTNKVKPVDPPPKLRLNPYNPKVQYIPDPSPIKSKSKPNSNHRNTLTKSHPFPVRIRPLMDMRDGREPEILKSLLTARPEMLVSEPEIMQSRPESPEALISEPEINSFQVENIVTEPDTYDNNSDGSDDENNLREQPRSRSGDSDCEVELGAHLDINKIIGVDVNGPCDEQDKYDHSEVTVDADHEVEDEEAVSDNSDEGNAEEDIEDENAEDEEEMENDDRNETVEDDNSDSEVGHGLVIEEDTIDGDHVDVIETVNPEDEVADASVRRDSEEGAQYSDAEEDDDIPPVSLMPIVELNEPDAETPVDDPESVENVSQLLNESVDIKGIELGVPGTITPAQKAFITKYRDVIEQINTMRCHCCDRSYPRRKAVIQHLQKSGMKIPKHTCYNCVVTYGHIGALLSHMRAQNCTNAWRLIYEEGGIPDSMVREATVVEEYADDGSLIKNDLLNKSQYKDILNARSYACKLCPAKFQLKQFIMKHVLDVHENGGQRIPLLCSHCKYRFKDNKVWKKHIRNGECTVNIACDLCPEKFRSLQHFTDHAWAVHAGGVADQGGEVLSRAVDGRPTDCPLCHKTTTTYHNLVKHLKSVHNEEKPHMCQHCDAKYAMVTELNQHIYQQHSDRGPGGEQPDLSIVKQEVTTYNYSCTECSSMFDTVDGWTEHQISAHHHEAFECDRCDKKFLQDSELADHKNSHLRIKYYSCTLCSNSYNSNQSLSEHMVKSHQGETLLDASEENPFFCEVCLRAFKSRQAFSNHMRIHSKVPTTNRRSGEPKPVIEIKRAPLERVQIQPVSYHNYKKNSKSISGAPYSCDICGKGFLHKKNIWKHKKILHSDVVSNDSTLSTGFAASTEEEEEYGNEDFGMGISIPQFDSFTNTNFMEQPTISEPTSGSELGLLYQCDLCDKKFAVKSSIWKHKRVKHGIINPNLQEEILKSEPSRTSCTICNIQFTDKKAYYRHRKNVHTVSVQVCKICGKSLNSTLGLYEHLKAAHAKELLGYNEGQGKVQNDEPQPKIPTGDEEVNQSLSQPAEQFQAKYPCDACGKNFIGMMALQNHKCIQPNPNSDRYDCEICNKSYTSISALKSHRGWHLRSPDGKAAFSNSGLWMPQHRVTSKVSKHELPEMASRSKQPSYADIPPLQIKRRFPPDIQVTLLKKRKLTDEVTLELVKAAPKPSPPRFSNSVSGEDRFCEPCGKAFTKKAAYLRHVDEVHRPNSVFCPICNKSFTRKSTLLVHMQKHDTADSSEPVEAEDSEPEGGDRDLGVYSCDLCDVQYSTPKSLRRHCIKHHNVTEEDMVEEASIALTGTGTRTIEVGGSKRNCGQCKEEFNSDQDMWQHRHFQCQPCGLFFPRPHLLAVHSRSCHADKEKLFFPCSMCDRFYMNKKSLQRHIEAAH